MYVLSGKGLIYVILGGGIRLCLLIPVPLHAHTYLLFIDYVSNGMHSGIGVYNYK